MPNEVAPAKNCTLLTVSSGSEAVALITPLHGAMKVAPLVGPVIATVGGTLTAWTATDPVMNEVCTLHQYGKLPAEEKVWLKENGSVLIPESHKLGLLVLVVECRFISVMLQFHCTVSFTLMVTLAGEKKLSPTVTEVVAAELKERPGPVTHRAARSGTKARILFIVFLTGEMHELTVRFRSIVL